MTTNPISYTYKYSDRFTQICKPIFDTSPITFCSIGRIFSNGTYTSFMSDPLWTDLYLNKHYLPTLQLFIEHKISQAKIGYDLWTLSSLFPTNADTKELYNDCNLFKYNNGINIIDTYSDYHEVTTFASPFHEGIDNYFIEKQDILRNYILYLKEKIKSDHVLLKEFDHQYHLPFSVNVKNKNNDDPNDSILHIKKYYLGYPLQEDKYLTQRELDCLLPIILGIPKKQIASHLQLSVRTIESYIDNIKLKCHYLDLVTLRLLFINNKFISSLISKTLNEYL